MKFTSTLNKKVKKFVKKFGITAVLSDKDFAFYPVNNLLTYSIYRYDNDHELVDFVEEKYNVNIKDYFFVFSLLHEIGHHKTWRNFTEQELNQDSFLREVIHAIANYSHSDANLMYFNLPTEDAANRWAIEYIDSHLEECWKFQNRCMKILRHVYKKKSFSY